jgi:hypothetical protein
MTKIRFPTIYLLRAILKWQAILSFLRFKIRLVSPHLEAAVLGDLEIVGRAPASLNRSCLGCYVDTIPDQRVVDMNTDRFAKHQPLIDLDCIAGLQPDDLGDFASELDRTCRHARRRDHARWRLVEPASSNSSTPDATVTDEAFIGSASPRVAGLQTNSPVARASQHCPSTPWMKTDDRRNIVEEIEETIRSQIGDAVNAEGADPADRQFLQHHRRVALARLRSPISGLKIRSSAEVAPAVLKAIAVRAAWQRTWVP